MISDCLCSEAFLTSRVNSTVVVMATEGIVGRRQEYLVCDVLTVFEDYGISRQGRPGRMGKGWQGGSPGQ